MRLIKLKSHLIKFKWLYIFTLLFFLGYYFLLPKVLFPKNYSTVVYDRDGILIGARIAEDGQWRFPEDSIVPEKFKKALLNFEDQYFFWHPGFNPFSLARAVKQNLKAGRIVSGGSTITSQVIRLYRNKKSRTIKEKIIELFLSTRLEIGYSKKRILEIYAAHAPFGGNVVGLNAASWRYFGRSPKKLSWAESALLAILPNSPAMIHPGKNRNLLLNKRNRLLKQLYFKGELDKTTYELSLLEPLPEKPLGLPDICPQLTELLKKKNLGFSMQTSIKEYLQKKVNRLVLDYYNQLRLNEIHNAAVLILDVKSNKVLAYTGNIPELSNSNEGGEVDLIQASRSTGSILKPLLYTAMLQEGLILPGTLVPDIPTRISGFKPDNYDLTFDGAVPAKRALARSLNIPAVRMLQSYGVPKFYNFLKHLGMNTLIFPPDHYGLTLIVGGAEGRLWDIAGIYCNLARTLNFYNSHNSYNSELFNAPSCLLDQKNKESDKNTKLQVNAGAIWNTFESLLEVNRPEEEAGWTNLSSSRKIAWKTGTSYGFRDAWAIGTTPEYVVGVWVGNADGEGRPGLTGAGTAAPLLFRIFNSLPATSWFQKPFDELEKIPVCHESGYKAGSYCDHIDSVYVPRNGLRTTVCPYHVLVHLSKDEKFRVTNKCIPVGEMIHKHWFILPPAMEWYYKKKNVFYTSLPPIMPGCGDGDDFQSMELIYPMDILKIYIPKEIDGTPGKTVFEIAHRNPDAVVYWHLDEQYMGSTRSIHQMALAPNTGRHLLTAVDNEGKTLSRWFEVVSKN